MHENQTETQPSVAVSCQYPFTSFPVSGPPAPEARKPVIMTCHGADPRVQTDYYSGTPVSPFRPTLAKDLQAQRTNPIRPEKESFTRLPSRPFKLKA